MTKQNHDSLRGVYAITDAALTPAQRLRDEVERVLQGGVRMVQYRDKSQDPALRLAQATELVRLCHAHSALLIVNDDVDLAKACAADGVHLGKDDETVQRARATLGTQRLIGVSCYDSLHRAATAVTEGADYIAFGSFFASSVKPHAVRAPLSLLAEAKQRWRVPVCAIGGIDARNAPELIANGADMLAVISALFAASDPRASALALSALFP
ncbi:MAG: thiamine phosphate synthase [Gammaproteobacteria bacterium]|nr:thiamine phosphate synthase [Gammaproteobacteria bacterium]